MKTIIYILLFTFGCQPVKNKKKSEGLELRWQQGTRSFKEFVNTLPTSDGNKNSLISYGYDSYGRVNIINNHKSVVTFHTPSHVFDVTQTFYYKAGGVVVGSGTNHEPIRRIFPSIYKTLASGDSTTFYLIYKSYTKHAYSQDSIFPVDSIENSFNYRINTFNNHKKDTVVFMDLLLKKDQNQRFVMIPKIANKIIDANL